VARQHFLPASYIGGFSPELQGRRRDRRVWVARRGDSRAFRSRAASLGFAKNLYVLQEQPGHLSGVIDKQWQSYERGLSSAIDRAANVPDEPLDGQAWLSLVMFVAGLFVRSPDYGDADQAWLESFFDHDVPGGMLSDNANLNRMLDFQWLCSTLLFCRWSLVRLGHARAVTNDIGYCLAPDLDGRPAGAIPLRPDLLLLVSQGPGNLRAWWDGERWRMEGFDIVLDDPGNPGIQRINATLASTARQEVYGSSEEDVSQAILGWSRMSARVGFAPPPQLLYASPEKRRELEDRIFTAMALLSEPPTERPPWILRFDSAAPWSKESIVPDDRLWQQVSHVECRVRDAR
jgi:hypothetical protein